VIHVSEKIEPRDDIDIINTELILADIETIEKHAIKIQKESKSDPKKRDELECLLEIKENLNKGIILKSKIQNLKSTLPLLTAKPVIYLFNVDEETLTNNDRKTDLEKLVAPATSIFVCAKLEDELKSLTPEDSAELLESYGVSETGLLQLVQAAYDILGLQSYLTAGSKEVRAWTIKKGATAPQAAGVIHGDFERGFIAAEIVDYDDLIDAGSKAVARSSGKMRTEGKTYFMQPNDVVEFRFNV
jgi:GTP-binding protein YchF